MRKSIDLVVWKSWIIINWSGNNFFNWVAGYRRGRRRLWWRWRRWRGSLWWRICEKEGRSLLIQEEDSSNEVLYGRYYCSLKLIHSESNVVSWWRLKCSIGLWSLSYSSIQLVLHRNIMDNHHGSHISSVRILFFLNFAPTAYWRLMNKVEVDIISSLLSFLLTV